MSPFPHDELISVLAEIRQLAPDFRLGQLLGVLTGNTEYENVPNAVVIIEDDELLPAAREFLESYRISSHERIEESIRLAASNTQMNRDLATVS